VIFKHYLLAIVKNQPAEVTPEYGLSIRTVDFFVNVISENQLNQRLKKD